MELDESLDLLGLNRGCSSEEVKNAFRNLSRIYHSDRYKSEDADEKFRTVHAAYQTALKHANSGRKKKDARSKLKTKEQVFVQWMTKFQSQLESGDYDDALDSIEKVAILRPDDSDVLMEKFDLLVKLVNVNNISRGKSNDYFNETLAIADLLLEKLPGSDFKGRGYVYNEVGALYTGRGQKRKALFQYSKSAREDGGEPTSLYNFATTLYQLDMLDDAVDVFGKLIEEFPKDALAIMEELSEKNPDDSFYASLYAKALEDNGYEHNAKKWRKQAKHLNKKYGGALIID